MRRIGLRIPCLFVMLAGYLSGCGIGSQATAPRSGQAEPPRPETVTYDQKPSAIPEPETEDVFVPEPSPSEPVKAAMKIRPASVSAGGTVEILVAIRVAGAHYLHAARGPGDKFIPLGIDVTLPAGVEATKEWEFPVPTTGRAGAPEYRDSILLKRSLNVSSSLPPQTMVFNGELRYQACTDELCWPAGRMKLSAPLLILTKPR
jgi:DsbC/DsbD-like thiol-disulfide interchange protein